MIQEDRYASVRLLEQQLNIPKSTIHRILTEHLSIRHIAFTWVPHFLTTEQMQQRVEACSENLALIVEDPSILSKIITVDECWIHFFDLNTKCESEAWKRPEEPRPKKVQQQKSTGKVLLISFFDCHGLVYQHYCPPKTRINAEYYLKTRDIAGTHSTEKTRPTQPVYPSPR